jgi:putative lipoic acid-binding regulatory protein
MKTCRLTIPIIVLVFFSCKNHAPGTTAADTTKIAAKDTASAGDESGYPTKYIEHARLELRDQIVTLTSRFAVVNGNVDEKNQYNASSNYFIYVNKKTGKADTLEAGLENLGGCTGCKYILRDMTDSFQSKTLIVQVVTPATDIYYTNSFVGYLDGKFQKLFSIEDDQEDGIELHREGSTLTDIICGRDEVVDNLEHDYPIKIDTKTFQITYIRPEKQHIGWNTRATESFRAHRVIAGKVDGTLVTVKAGEEVTVDTLYRALRKVRLHVADSVIVEVKMETARKKLAHNIAG